MTETLLEESFRRGLAAKSRFSGHVTYGYSHDQGVKDPTTNVVKNEYSSMHRQRRATEWQPKNLLEHPRPYEIMCYMIYHAHVGHIPNYGGHIPGAQFRFGQTYGKDTLDAKRWLRGEHKPN